MNFPRDLKYSKDHEWTKAEQGVALIGITDYAQDKLGSIVFVELPGVGNHFQKGDVLVTVDSVKAVAEVYAPVSGRVEAINESLRENPEWINRDPYGQGWMVKLKMTDANETDALLPAEAYQAFVAEEAAKG
jgi:glycine cleavage system H protein